MNIKINLIFVLVLLGGIEFTCFAQNPNWENIIFGGRTVTAIIEDESSIWAGADIGLIKIDKTSEKIFIYDKTYGLPAHYVTALTKDSSGNIWFGLADESNAIGCGLVKYDGINFEIFNSSNSVLSQYPISALFCDRDNVLWIGCSRFTDFAVLVKYTGTIWTVYDSNNSLIPWGREITSITEDNSKLWISTHGGLVSFDRYNWQIYKTDNSELTSQIINNVFVDKNNNKWIGMAGGVAKYDDVDWTIYNDDDSTTLLYCNEVYNISIDKENCLWIGSYKGLIKYDFIKWTILNSSNSKLPANEIKVFLIDDQNNKWIGSYNSNGDGRLSKFNGEDWKNYKTWKGDLLPGEVKFLRQGNNDDFLIGTNTGLNTIKPGIWSSFQWRDSLFEWDYSFDAFTIGVEDDYWFAVSGNYVTPSSRMSGLLKYDGAEWAKLDPENSNLPICEIYDIDYSAVADELWLATSAGLLKYDWNSFQKIDVPQNLYDGSYFVHVRCNDDITWVGFSSGLLKYHNGLWQLYNEENSSLPENNITNIECDSQNNLWLGTGNGLAKFNDTDWTIYNTDNSSIPDDRIQDLCIDLKGNIWIATMDGALKFDGSIWKNFNIDNSPLLGDNVSRIGCDIYDNIWMYDWNNMGVSVYNETGLINNVDEAPYCKNEGFILDQNYPNPFNPNTTIRFSIPNSNRVIIEIYDVLGREVKSLMDKFMSAGTHMVEFSTSMKDGLSSGVYFYRIIAGNYSETKKMILLR